MPIKIPNELPASKTLRDENIFVMNETRAITQDIRPLSILVLNLMPTKIETETQLARLLGNTPIQVELELMQMKNHRSKNVSQEHMLKFYQTFDAFKHRYFDGMVITGAPLEHLEFEEVEYWDELCEIMEWSKTHVTSTIPPSISVGEHRQDCIIIMESLKKQWIINYLEYFRIEWCANHPSCFEDLMIHSWFHIHATHTTPEKILINVLI